MIKNEGLALFVCICISVGLGLLSVAFTISLPEIAAVFVFAAVVFGVFLLCYSFLYDDGTGD